LTKQLLFSLTAKDFEWDYVRGSGKGGQKRNKTSNAVRCRHLASGAMGFAEDERSQIHNKRLAFARMTKTKEFQKWLRIEIARRTGDLTEIQRKIDKELKNTNITKVETKNEKGQWVVTEVMDLDG